MVCVPLNFFALQRAKYGKIKILFNFHNTGYRYLAQGSLERQYMHDFIRYEMLRKEYLNQTFNFMPGVQEVHKY